MVDFLAAFFLGAFLVDFLAAFFLGAFLGAFLVDFLAAFLGAFLVVFLGAFLGAFFAAALAFPAVFLAALVAVFFVAVLAAAFLAAVFFVAFFFSGARRRGVALDPLRAGAALVAFFLGLAAEPSAFSAFSAFLAGSGFLAVLRVGRTEPGRALVTPGIGSLRARDAARIASRMAPGFEKNFFIGSR